MEKTRTRRLEDMEKSKLRKEIKILDRDLKRKNYQYGQLANKYNQLKILLEDKPELCEVQKR